MAASRKQADEIAAELSGTLTVVLGASRDQRGALLPRRRSSSSNRRPVSVTQVSALKAGQAVALPESYGYQVVQVRSRASIPFDDQTAADIEVVASAVRRPDPGLARRGRGHGHQLDQAAQDGHSAGKPAVRVVDDGSAGALPAPGVACRRSCALLAPWSPRARSPWSASGPAGRA